MRPSHRFRSLDGWRGVCAMMVVLFHLNAGAHIYALTRNGWAAVDFFFVLSGFVLMSAFEQRVGDAPAFRSFAIRRLARLYPLHLFALAVLLAMLAVGAVRKGAPLFEGSHGLAALLQCLALVQGFTTNQLSWNFPSWSISLELWASLTFGLTLWLAGARRLILFGAYCLALGACVVAFGEPDGPAGDEIGVLLKDAHYIAAFFAGTLLFKLYERIGRSGWRRPIWAELPATALVGAIFLWADKLPAVVMNPLFALVILTFAFDEGPVSRLLKTAPFQAAGRWSYSIYLIHPFLTLAAYHAVQTVGSALRRPALIAGPSGDQLVLGGPLAMDLLDLTTLAAVVATAAVTYRLIELPGQRLAEKLAS